MKSNSVHDEIFRRKTKIVLRLVELDAGEYGTWDSKRDKSSLKLLGASNGHKLSENPSGGEGGTKDDLLVGQQSKTNDSDEDEDDSCCCDCCCGCMKKLCRRRNKKKKKREKEKSEKIEDKK